MKRITGRYGELKAKTTSLRKIDGVDYRIAGVDGAIVLAFDHENGIVIHTGFYEIDDFEPNMINGKEFRSDYHDMVLDCISESIHRDEIDASYEDAYSERLHP